MSWKHGKCLMFGGYPVSYDQVCDSYERGKPDSKEMEGDEESRPHHLHQSDGTNRCGNCAYYSP